MEYKIKNDLQSCTRVVSFGCSMTVGQELSDYTLGSFSNKSWAAKIAAIYDKQYISFANEGAGNDCIVRKVMHYIKNNRQDGDFIIIGWSGLSRREFYLSSENRYMNLLPNHRTIVSGRVTPAKESMIAAFESILAESSDLSDIETFANQCTLLYHFLESKNMPFLMTSSLWNPRRLPSDEQQPICNTDTDLIHSLRKFYTKESLMSMCWNANIPKHPGGHPVELGHKLWANIISDWYNNET
jgi:hypothetical protein